MSWQDDIGTREVLVLNGSLAKDDNSDFTDEDVEAFLQLLVDNGYGFGGSIGFPTTAESSTPK